MGVAVVSTTAAVNATSFHTISLSYTELTKLNRIDTDNPVPGQPKEVTITLLKAEPAKNRETWWRAPLKGLERPPAPTKPADPEMVRQAHRYTGRERERERRTRMWEGRGGQGMIVLGKTEDWKGGDENSHAL